MTVKRLFLVRHAKAEAGGSSDVKRRLAPRGERDAPEIGRWLQEAGVASGVALVSPAKRTVQTWELAAAELTRAPRTELDKRIYEASVEDLLAVINEAPPQARTLVVVGHNPSVEALAGELDGGKGDRAAAKEMARKFPTSGIAAFEVNGPWSALAPGGATLVSFAAPRG